MTERPTEQFRQEHAQLLEHIEHLRVAAREIPGLSIDERRELINRVLDFLEGTLLAHARAEEEVLYPEWARLVGYPDAAAPMVHDHEAIVARVAQLKAARPEDTDSVQELLYELHGLILVHFAKEEDIQLPVFDEQPRESVSALLARMHAGAPEHSHEG